MVGNIICYLGGKRRALAGSTESAAAGGCPRERVSLSISNSDDCVIELDLIRCHTCSNAGEPKHFKKVGQVSTSPVKGFGKMVDVYQCIDYCIDGKVSIPDEDEVV